MPIQLTRSQYDYIKSLPEDQQEAELSKISGGSAAPQPRPKVQLTRDQYDTIKALPGDVQEEALRHLQEGGPSAFDDLKAVAAQGDQPFSMPQGRNVAAEWGGDIPILGSAIQGFRLGGAALASSVGRVTGIGDADKMQRGISQFRQQSEETAPGMLNTGIRTIAEGATMGIPVMAAGPAAGAVGGAAIFGTTAADRAIYEGRQQGLEGDDLRNYVAAQGAVGAGFGAIPGANVIGKATGRAVGRAVARGAAAGAGESLAETGVRTAFDVNAPETWGGVAEEALLSAAMGGAFVLPAGIRKGLQEGKVKAREMAKRRIAEQVKADADAAARAQQIARDANYQPDQYGNVYGVPEGAEVASGAAAPQPAPQPAMSRADAPVPQQTGDVSSVDAMLGVRSRPQQGASQVEPLVLSRTQEPPQEPPLYIDRPGVPTAPTDAPAPPPGGPAMPRIPMRQRTIADLPPDQQAALRQLREQNPQGGVTASQIKAVVGGTKESVKALRDEVNTFPVYRPGGVRTMGEPSGNLRQMPTSPTMQEYTSTTPQPARGWFMDPAGKPTLPPTPADPRGMTRQGGAQPGLTQMRRPYMMEGGIADEVQMQGQGRQEEVGQTVPAAKRTPRKNQVVDDRPIDQIQREASAKSELREALRAEAGLSPVDSRAEAKAQWMQDVAKTDPRAAMETYYLSRLDAEKVATGPLSTSEIDALIDDGVARGAIDPKADIKKRVRQMRGEAQSTHTEAPSTRRERRDEADMSGLRHSAFGKRYISGEISRDEFLAVANRSINQDERNFSDALSNKYFNGATFADGSGNARPIALYSNVLESSASRSKDAAELSRIASSMTGLPNEEDIALAIAMNPHSSADSFAAARNNKALLRYADPDDIRRIDTRRSDRTSTAPVEVSQSLDAPNTAPEAQSSPQTAPAASLGAQQGAKQPWEMTRDEYVEGRAAKYPDVDADLMEMQRKSWAERWLASFTEGSPDKEIPQAVFDSLPEGYQKVLVQTNNSVKKMLGLEGMGKLKPVQDYTTDPQVTKRRYAEIDKANQIADVPLKEYRLREKASRPPMSPPAWMEVSANHRKAVDDLLRHNQPVPPAVLADYPDLAAKYGKAQQTDTAPPKWTRGKDAITTEIDGTPYRIEKDRDGTRMLFQGDDPNPVEINLKSVADAKRVAEQRARQQDRGNIFTDETGAVMNPLEFAQGVRELAKDLPAAFSQKVGEYFKTYGNAPGALSAAQEARRGGEQANVYVAAQNAALMQQAARNEYKGVLPPEAMMALKGDQKALASLKPETRARVAEMRQHLDDLQRDFLSNLDPASRTSRIVADSVGEYVNRSYHIFDLKTVSERARNRWLSEREKTPMWESVVTERMRTKGEGRVQAENEVRQELLNYATQGEFSPGITGRLGAQDISTLKKMKDLSPQWRSLMGEVTDPILNYERTQQKLTSLATGARFQNTVLEAGQQQGWLAPAEKAKAGWRQISPDEARNMGPLAGMWAPKEVADVINQSLRTVQKMEGWRAGLQRVNQGIKYMQTVGNLPVSAARQAPQGFLTVVQSGLNPMNLSQWGEAYKLAAYHATHGTAAGAKLYNKKMDARLKRMAALGVLDSEVNIQSQIDSLQRAGLDTREQFFLNPLGARGAKTASRIYMVPDNATKMYAFMQLEKQYKGYMDKQRMTPEQRDVFISTKVKDQFPTYQRNPRAIQMFQDLPLSNPFVSFMYQTVRTQGNVVKASIDNARSGDPELQRIAKKQIAGLLAANLGATAGIQAMSQAYFGVTEEDEKVLRDASPSWVKDSPRAYLGKDAQGRIMAMDLAYSSTGPGTIVPLLALLNAPEGEKMAAAAEALSGAFFGLSPALEAGGEALFGVNPRTGKEISGPRASTAEKALDRVRAVSSRALVGFKTLEQGKAAFTTGEYKDRPISPASFMAKNMGFPTDIVDPVAELKYAARGWSGKWRPEYDKLIDSGTSRLEARKAINERRRDEFDVVVDRIKAMVATGVKKSEIRKSLVQDGMSMQAATDLVMGRYRPWRPQE